MLDTGSVLTTLVPEIAETIGYTAADRITRSVVRSAVAEERGYVVRMSGFSAFGFSIPNMHVNVAALGRGIEGVLGMNFLSEFNVEIRPAERRILVERVVL